MTDIDARSFTSRTLSRIISLFADHGFLTGKRVGSTLTTAENVTPDFDFISTFCYGFISSRCSTLLGTDVHSGITCDITFSTTTIDIASDTGTNNCRIY